MSASDRRSDGVQLSSRPSGGGRKKLPLGLAATAIVVVGGIVLALSLWNFLTGGTAIGAVSAVPTVKARRGPLTISFNVSGSLQALKSQDVKSQVEGNNQILYIVPEGTLVTEQDVKDHKVLVQLDSSSLQDKQAARAITVESAQADLVQAQQNLIVQKKQNENDLATAELTLKFSKLTLSQYLGDALAKKVLAGDYDFTQIMPVASYQAEAILNENAQTATAAVPVSAVRVTTAAPHAAGAIEADPPAAAPDSGRVGSGGKLPVRQIMGVLYQPPDKAPAMALAGTAEQSLRQFSSAVQLADQDLLQSATTLAWTRQLVAHKYETTQQLVTDQLAYNRNQVALNSAEEALRLFIRFTLPEQAEQDYSDYKQAVLGLARTQASAAGKLAQAEANLSSRKAILARDQDQYDKGQKMLADSTIRATSPGMVVYASTTDPWRFQNNPLQPGTSLWQNETIFSLPDIRTLSAQVEVPESDISRIKVGQPAIVTVGVLHGHSFAAHVAKISPMASAQNRWLNPNDMVYDTWVSLDHVPTDGSLTVGMSADAQIIVARLKDAVYVPSEAVDSYNGERICYVKGPDGPDRRPVTTGYYTAKYVQITKGLSEGETVYLSPPPEFAQDVNQQQATKPTGQPGGKTAAGAQKGRQTAAAAETGAGNKKANAASGAGEQGARQGGRGGWAGLDPQILAKFRTLRNLPADQRAKKLQEILQSLPAAQRQQVQQMMQHFGGHGGRGGWSGGHGGGRGQQPAGAGGGPS